MKSFNDRGLFARCRAGKESAWDQLLESHYDSIGRFVFLSAPDLSESEVPEVCRRTFVRAVGEIQKAGEEPSCRVWLLRAASKELRQIGREKSGDLGRTSCDPRTGLSPSGQSHGWNGGGSDAMMRQLRGQFDRLGGPCVELAEMWFFSDLPEAEVAAALEVSSDLLLRRLRMCLQRMETLEPVLEVMGRESVDMPYPADFARRDVGNPLGTRLAVYAKERSACIGHAFPVPRQTREELLGAVRSAFRKPYPVLHRSMLSWVAPYWRMTATAVGGTLVLVMALLHGESGWAPARTDSAAVSNSYWSTRSELPRVSLPEFEPDFACPTGSNGDLRWSIASAPEPTREAAPPEAPARIGLEETAESDLIGGDQSDLIAEAAPGTDDVTDSARDEMDTPSPSPAMVLAVVDRPAPATHAPVQADIEASQTPESTATRLRQFVRANPASQFRRNFNSPPMPAVLEIFDAELTESGVSLVDADGSVYAGTVSWVAGREDDGDVPQAPRLAIEANGVHRTTGESVVFKGWLIPRRTVMVVFPPSAQRPSDPAAGPEVPLLADGEFAIEGEVRYGARTRFPVRAGASQSLKSEAAGAPATHQVPST